MNALDRSGFKGRDGFHDVHEQSRWDLVQLTRRALYGRGGRRAVVRRGERKRGEKGRNGNSSWPWLEADYPPDEKPWRGGCAPVLIREENSPAREGRIDANHS